MKFAERYNRIRSEKYGITGFDFLDVYDIESKEFYVRRNSMDQTLLDSIFINECYNPNMWFNRNLREVFRFENVNSIIDAGANIGITSCYFATLFPDATIFSFEVEDANYDLLCKNTKNYKNIKTFKKAVWKDSQGVYICNRDRIYGHSGKANPAKYEVGDTFVDGEELIASTCVSKIVEEMNLKQIDILKIDIQGAEIEAFCDWELWLPKVRLLFVETHDLFRRGCSNKVFESIAKCGMFSFIGSPNGEILAFLKESEL